MTEMTKVTETTKVTCGHCSALSEIITPSESSPGGGVLFLCPKCGETTVAPNPAGDANYVFATDTWLIPVFEVKEGARARGKEGRVMVNTLVGFRLAQPGDDGARFFPAGSSTQRHWIPAEMLNSKKVK